MGFHEGLRQFGNRVFYGTDAEIQTKFTIEFTQVTDVVIQCRDALMDFLYGNKRLQSRKMSPG
jgi:hypothetical protein